MDVTKAGMLILEEIKRQNDTGKYGVIKGGSALKKLERDELITNERGGWWLMPAALDILVPDEVTTEILAAECVHCGSDATIGRDDIVIPFAHECVTASELERFRAMGAFEAPVAPKVSVADCEALAVAHYANATSEDTERSWGRGEIYMKSFNALTDAIELVYPDVVAYDVYTSWVENGEDIAWAVRTVREQRHMDALIDHEAWTEDRCAERLERAGFSGKEAWDAVDRLWSLRTDVACAEYVSALDCLPARVVDFLDSLAVGDVLWCASKGQHVTVTDTGNESVAQLWTMVTSGLWEHIREADVPQAPRYALSAPVAFRMGRRARKAARRNGGK